ncbi:MAG: hypothetical protein LH618_08870 [Saprospiraceae bacterium]|nr:hypothetical protein [Saprospiraceae bacterium]
MYLRFFIGVFALLLTTMMACERDYTDLRQRELASGVRNDSIFMGLYFGMPRSAFYVHCHEMNQQGLVTNGTENISVLYMMSGYRQPIEVNFYPDFSEDKIYNMKVWMNYQTWAPWNKEYYAERLVPDALAILEKWYGSGFVKQRNQKGQPTWAKVNGNREVILRILDERRLRVDITDISVQPKPNPSTAGQPTGPRPLWEKQAK